MQKSNVTAHIRDFLAECRAVNRTSNARMRLPPGSTRARVTTANARWASACEARDRGEAMLESRGYGALVPLIKEVARLERMGMDPTPARRALAEATKQAAKCEVMK